MLNEIKIKLVICTRQTLDKLPKMLCRALAIVDTGCESYKGFYYLDVIAARWVIKAYIKTTHITNLWRSVFICLLNRNFIDALNTSFTHSEDNDAVQLSIVFTWMKI